MLCSTQGCVNGQNKEHESGIYVPGVAVGVRVLLFIAKTSQALLQASSDRGAGGQAAAAVRRLTGGRGEEKRPRETEIKRPETTGWRLAARVGLDYGGVWPGWKRGDGVLCSWAYGLKLAMGCIGG
jgi:hypothetical protein